MAIQNPYYSQILLTSKRSQHLTHTKVRERSDRAKDSYLNDIPEFRGEEDPAD